MRYEKLPSALYTRNRKALAEQLESKGLAFFNSNDCYPVSADTTLPFEQHRDLFYLSGVNQEETILLVYKKNDSIYQERFFLRLRRAQSSRFGMGQSSQNQRYEHKQEYKTFNGSQHLTRHFTA